MGHGIKASNVKVDKVLRTVTIGATVYRLVPNTDRRFDVYRGEMCIGGFVMKRDGAGGFEIDQVENLVPPMPGCEEIGKFWLGGHKAGESPMP